MADSTPTVWGGLTVRRGHPRQVRVVVQARSRAAAVRALAAAGMHGMTDGYLRDYWSTTENQDDVAAALAAGPGVPVWRSEDPADRTTTEWQRWS